jgi:tetratricopeptide (TPR) repeat protein
MLRMLIGSLLVLSLGAVVFADDPKPQWQRLLTGDDAKKAAELQKRIAQLETVNKYAEGIRSLEELLALRTKVQGADHWETVNAKWHMTALKRTAALPEDDRAAWRQASRRNEEAYLLEEKAQYDKARTLRLENLKTCLHVLGENHPYTADCYNDVAFNLAALGEHAEAGPLFQKALDIHLNILGEDHPSTARSYNNVGFNLHAREKYAEAGLHYRKALIIRLRILGKDHPDTAAIYNNLASNLNTQGTYEAAGPLFQEALDIRLRVLSEDHADTAGSYNNVGFNLAARGRYAEAGPLYQKALHIRRKLLGDDHPDMATPYNNLGLNLDDQGKYEEAEPLFQKALDIRLKVLGEDHRLTAAAYSNLAANLNAQRKYAEAGSLFQKALEIWRRVHSEEHSETATGYNNVAFNLNALGKHAEAGPLFQKALDIRLKVQGENHPDTAKSYFNVAANLDAQGEYAEAEPRLQKALNIRRNILGEGHRDTAQSYSQFAINLHTQGKRATALEYLAKAAHSYEAARQGVAVRGLERASFGAERSPYGFLAAALGWAGRSADAWAALEANLARGLLDEMAFRRGGDLTPDDQRRRAELQAQRSPINHSILALVRRPERTDAEAAELERLIEQRKGLDKSLIELAAAASRREVASLAQVQAALPADAAFVAWVDVADKSGGVQEHWGCVVRSSGAPKWNRLPGSGTDGKWTKEDAELPARFREGLVKAAPASEIDALAKKLHAQRLAPLSKHLAGVKRLFVAPVNQMAAIPIEALTDQYTVSYTPSGTYLARLKYREKPHSNGMLAIGDPLFPTIKEAPQPTALPPSGFLITQVVPNGNAAKAKLQAGDVLVAYAGEELSSMEQLDKLLAANSNSKSVILKVWREGQDKQAERELAGGRMGVNLAKEPAREAIQARRQTNQMLAKLTRGESFVELPGTQVEINRLSKLFDVKNVTTVTRSDANEQKLEEMRKADKLKQFKYLHFATHGKANNFRSFDSALILTPPEKVPEPRAGEPWLDGRLTAAEVLEYWKLDAELVTLSACESALGRQGGGDGLLGFAQAFLLAGSRSVCLTLWQVDDTATALLIDRFYRNLLGKRDDGAKPMGKAVALQEAKQWLRNLSSSEALERLGTLTNGVVRGERPAREEMKPVPVPKDSGKDYKPYAHPRYWAAFILIGDPD